MEERTVHPVKSYDFAPNSGNIKFEAPSINEDKYGNVRLSYHGSLICIQTHKIKIPFGFSKGVPNTPTYGRDFQIQINLETENYKGEPNNKGIAFKKGLEDLEEVVIQEAYQNRLLWGLYPTQRTADKASLEDVRKKFSPIIKPSRDDRYPDTMKLSFKKEKNQATGQWEIKTECYDQNKTELVPSETTIPRRAFVVAIMFAKSVWLSPTGKFGIKWELSQLKVYPPEARDDDFNIPKGVLLLDSSDDEEDESDE